MRDDEDLDLCECGQPADGLTPGGNPICADCATPDTDPFIDEDEDA